MEDPLFVINQKVFNAQSMTSTATSETLDIAETIGFCVHAIWTGTPVGNLTYEGSNDSINFVVLTTQAAGGAAGQWLSNAEHQHFRYLRVKYTATSSTGSLTCYVSAKRD